MERTNREIGRILRTYCHDKHTRWCFYLEQTENWLNHSISESTNRTPWEVFKKQKPIRPIRDLIEFPKSDEETNIVKIVRKTLINKAQKRKLRADKNKQFIKYIVGQLVLVRSHSHSSSIDKEIKKFFLLYNGSYEIVKIIGVNTYVIRNCQTGQESVENVRNLRPYYQVDKNDHGTRRGTQCERDHNPTGCHDQGTVGEAVGGR